MPLSPSRREHAAGCALGAVLVLLALASLAVLAWWLIEQEAAAGELPW